MFKITWVAIVVLSGVASASATAQQPSSNTISHRNGLTCAMLSGRAWCGDYALASGLGSIAGLAPIPGDPGLVSIQASLASACGLTAGGELYCIGMNGQRRSAPYTREAAAGACGMDDGLRCSDHLVRVAAPLTFSALGMDGQTMCGITRAGKLWCWGNNEFGQLGIPPNRGTDLPMAVLPAMNFRAVVNPDNHTCVLTTAGAAWCWGLNLESELGLGFRDSVGATASRRPTRVTGNHLFTALSAGRNTTCGLTADGALFCWGTNPDSWDRYVGGGWCDTPGKARCLFESPTPVASSYRFRSISVGDDHLCGITMTGEPVCWGRNTQGKLGVGRGYAALPGSTQPLVVAGGLRFVAIAAGSGRTCGVTVQSVVYCWGHTHGDINDQQTTPERAGPQSLDDGLRELFARWAVPAPTASPSPPADGPAASPPPGSGKRRAPPSGMPHP